MRGLDLAVGEWEGLLDTVDARRVLDHLRGERDAMVRELTALAEMESPTPEARRQRPVFERLAGMLEAAGYRCRRFPGRESGGIMLAVPRSRERGRPYQLLLGHVDTVWPVGTLEEMPVRVDDGKLRGPGTFDMKGGLVQAAFALRALAELGLEPGVTPVFLINSDEEQGSRESLRHIERLARCADRAFVMEPALGPSGALKTARKGTGSFTVTVRGKSAHSGLNPEEGSSAIVALSEVVQGLHELNDPERGVTVNVGTIEGGGRTNVIAEGARAEVGVRVARSEDVDRLIEQIRGLRPSVPGTEVDVEGGLGRPPMERTPGVAVLWRAADRLGHRLGLDLEEGRSGGASDGNLTARFVPTLDGLGAVGDGAHAAHEHVRIDAMPERAALLALLLLLPDTGTVEQELNANRRPGEDE